VAHFKTEWLAQKWEYENEEAADYEWEYESEEEEEDEEEGGDKDKEKEKEKEKSKKRNEDDEVDDDDEDDEQDLPDPFSAKPLQSTTQRDVGKTLLLDIWRKKGKKRLETTLDDLAVCLLQCLWRKNFVLEIWRTKQCKMRQHLMIWQFACAMFLQIWRKKITQTETGLDDSVVCFKYFCWQNFVFTYLKKKQRKMR
jgi:hypothetical protein